MEQQKFYESLNQMLNVCVFSNGVLTTENLLELTEQYKATHKTIDALREELVVLRIKMIYLPPVLRASVVYILSATNA